MRRVGPGPQRVGGEAGSLVCRGGPLAGQRARHALLAHKVQCDSGRGGVVFVPDGQGGPAAPTIDPELVARKAAASMRLDGPEVASPRTAGT